MEGSKGVVNVLNRTITKEAREGQRGTAERGSLRGVASLVEGTAASLRGTFKRTDPRAS